MVDDGIEEMAQSVIWSGNECTSWWEGEGVGMDLQLSINCLQAESKEANMSTQEGDSKRTETTHIIFKLDEVWIILEAEVSVHSVIKGDKITLFVLWGEGTII